MSKNLNLPKKTVLYTRYSSDMQRDESCEDQGREVRQGLDSKGIDSNEALVLNDRAESGTKANRTEFDRLRAMIRRGEVGILAVDDQSRLSRADNVFGFIQDLVYQGGRFISTGENIDTHEEGWELRVKVMELHNSTTIRELGRRVHRGQKGRVLDDGAAGDHPFGYESYFLDPNWAEASRRGPKPKKGLRIHEPEARWVRQVFSWFTEEAMSIGAIARELNRLGVDKGRRATAPGWHHAQVRRMLANSKYAGRWAWGATRTLRSSDGRTKQVPVPDDQRVIRDRPELRIIDQATWERASEKLLELEAIYGQKPGQKSRGPRAHHTEVYPRSLLGGLLFCRDCGSRLWVKGTGNRTYLACPGHLKGACPMAGQVPAERAERALLDFVAELLRAWPGYLEAASTAMRRAVEEAAGRLPEALRADRERLPDLLRRIDNLVDQLADGTSNSPALRRKLEQLESEAAELHGRLERGRLDLEAAVALPDDAWLRSALAGLAPLLADDPARAAPLLQRLLGRVSAESVVAPGKVRGFIRLRIALDGRHVLAEALGGRLPGTMQALAGPTSAGSPEEFFLDLGGPGRRDLLAPEIAEMRARGVTWEEIGRATGLGTGNSHNVWKRWTDAREASRVASP